MLDANMPEEVYVWMSNLKRVLTPLLERAMDLLQAVQWAAGSRVVYNIWWTHNEQLDTLFCWVPRLWSLGYFLYVTRIFCV